MNLLFRIFGPSKSGSKRGILSRFKWSEIRGAGHLDQADSAFNGQCGQANSADATYTTNGTVLSISLNQRTTIVWTARPGYELCYPAVANNGFVLQTPTIKTGTPLGTATLLFEE